MSLAQTDIADAFSEMLVNFGDTITINGVSVQAIVSKDSLDTALEEGGYPVTGALVVRLLVAQLTTLPVHNAPILISGQRYKISEITQDPGSSVIKYRATRR